MFNTMTSSKLSIIYPFNYYLLRIIMYFNTVFIPTSKKNLYRSKMFHVQLDQEFIHTN